MTLCHTLSQQTFVQVLVTLWAIWWARRKAIHEEEFQSPLSTHQFIKRYISELVLEQGVQPGPHAEGRPNPGAWIAPSSGVMKLNVDGVVA
jgi:hypothetical protein